jgi:hypothetical protein
MNGKAGDVSISSSLARASAIAKKHDIELAPEDPYVADWLAAALAEPRPLPNVERFFAPLPPPLPPAARRGARCTYQKIMTGMTRDRTF